MKKQEQKPAEKQDYSGLNNLERAILRGFLAAGMENVPVTIIKETAKECLAQMKPAEWSEEEKRKLNRIYSIIGWAMDEHAFSSCKKLLGDKEGVELQDFLRSIAKPTQEWGEEDRNKVAKYLHERDGGMLWSRAKDITDDILDILRPSWKPSEEQMEVLLSTQDMVRSSGYRQNAKVLASLYEQLKKLLYDNRGIPFRPDETFL